ncbi:MAG: hypothetical protein WA941_23645 [Nitrososphaeraceae archaeon]
MVLQISCNRTSNYDGSTCKQKNSNKKPNNELLLKCNMVKIVTVLIMGFALSILLTAPYSFSAAFAGPEDSRLLETANISGTSENLTD